MLGAALRARAGSLRGGRQEGLGLRTGELFGTVQTSEKGKEITSAASSRTGWSAVFGCSSSSGQPAERSRA